jgi:hypothetical protein
MGRERAAGLLAFNGRSAAGTISGWLSSSHVSLPSNRQIFTYVNRRYVPTASSATPWSPATAPC